MVGAKTILYLLAFILLVLESLNVKAPRVVLGWLGLSLWLLGNILA